MVHSSHFDEAHVLHDLKHYLPSQTPLKDFIHHNSLHAFQHLDFYKAIFTAAEIFGIMPTLSLGDFRKMYHQGRIAPGVLNRVIIARKGHASVEEWSRKVLETSYQAPYHPRIGRLRAHWKSDFQINLDDLVHPLLFRITGSYLDQGIALQHFPFEKEGLLKAIRIIETNNFSSFFKTSTARKLLLQPDISIASLLERVVGDENFFEQYLYDQQFAHKGWSGMVSTIEDRPDSILYPKTVGLHDLVVLELLLEIDALEIALGEGWKPLCHAVNPEKTALFADVPTTELQEVLSIWQDAFEWSYYDEVLAGLRHLKSENGEELPQRKDMSKFFQAVFCIDERECSFRHHIEEVEPHCETLGCPGFFGVEFYFQPQGGKFYEKLCPAPVTPKYLIREYEATRPHGEEILYHRRSHSMLSGFFMSLSLGLVAAAKLGLALFRPKMSPAISDAFSHMSLDGKLHIENTDPNDIENGLQVGFTVEEMTDRVEKLLRGMGMVQNFAPLVYIIAHGSSSANNPHHGAHDCGACSGRPGATNARVFAFMANHLRVRTMLKDRGLDIPEKTRFIGAMHDTAADIIAYYDEEVLSAELMPLHLRNKQSFEDALDLNAKERSRRFASINTKAHIKEIRKAIQQRSVSMFEPRPELGHGTNALCFVGTRDLTKGLFLDRRAFMNSYDYRTDPDGKILLDVIRPLPVVCGGINLEYYFSRVDNQKMGAGTKLPHHVIGLIGVSNSSDGDLRPGLPWQMIEVHDPVRLLMLVEHYPEVILNTIQSQPALYEWFINDWVHLVAMRPETHTFHYFSKGHFHAYHPLADRIHKTDNLLHLIENAREMETNHILHATQENLPVHILKKERSKGENTSDPSPVVTTDHQH